MSFWERQNRRLFYICYFCTYSCTIEPLVSDHFFKIPKKFPSQITINETSRKRLLFVSDPTFREWPLRLDISGGCLREIWLYYYRSSLLFAICYFFLHLWIDLRSKRSVVNVTLPPHAHSPRESPFNHARYLSFRQDCRNGSRKLLRWHSVCQTMLILWCTMIWFMRLVCFSSFLLILFL